METQKLNCLLLLLLALSLAGCQVCGDGVLNRPQERCDDGNITPGDGCGADCQEERMFYCPTQGVACVRISRTCGNGAKNDNEECDDSNLVSGDGCSGICRIERCGNGLIESYRGEECDPPVAGSCDESCKKIPPPVTGGDP